MNLRLCWARWRRRNRPSQMRFVYTARVRRLKKSNHTAIEGHFDFLIDYPPDGAGTESTVLLLSAIQEIGLRLKTVPGSIDVLVIDHAEKPSAD